MWNVVGLGREPGISCFLFPVVSPIILTLKKSIIKKIAILNVQLGKNVTLLCFFFKGKDSLPMLLVCFTYNSNFDKFLFTLGR